MVSTHFDRCRVSNEKRPVGSVRDASMSPRASLTTNVLPSRMLTRSAIVWSREEPLEEHEELRIAFHLYGAPQRGRHGVDLAAHHPVEKLRVGADRRVGLAVGMRDNHVAAVDLDEPALRPTILELDPKRPLRLFEQGLVAATAERLEKLCCRLRHLRFPPPPVYFFSSS